MKDEIFHCYSKLLSLEDYAFDKVSFGFVWGDIKYWYKLKQS